MNDMCTDNRFALIKKCKKELIEATNIETSPEEMAVIDNILFRFWQMGWLDRLEQSEIIHCRDCVYGKQDDEYNWYCRDLGCVMGDTDGSGYCSDAVKLTPENAWKKCKKGNISRRRTNDSRNDN